MCQFVVLIRSTYCRFPAHNSSNSQRYGHCSPVVAADEPTGPGTGPGLEYFKMFKNVKLSCQIFTPTNDHADHANQLVSQGESQTIHQRPQLRFILRTRGRGRLSHAPPRDYIKNHTFIKCMCKNNVVHQKSPTDNFYTETNTRNSIKHSIRPRNFKPCQ